MKRLIWVTYDLPYPLNSGGKIRAYNLLKHLKNNFDVTLFSYYRKESQLEYLEEVKNVVSNVQVFKRRYIWDVRNLLLATFSNKPLLTISYENLSLINSLKREISKGDYKYIHFEFFGTSVYLSEVKKMGIKVVLGNENVEYEIYRKYLERNKVPILSKLMQYDVWKLQRLEEKSYRESDINIAVSESDMRTIKSKGGRNCFLVPNGVDVSYYRKFVKIMSQVPINKALFTGNLLYQQNNDAVKWFLTEVLPLILEKIPDFKLIIVSGYEPRWISRYHKFVELIKDDKSDFSSFVQLADVFILPVWVKSGTNIKLLQALACGVPVVSTTHGLSGYDFSGETVLSSDNTVGFAAKVVLLLKDYKLRKLTSARSLRAVEKYDWKESARALAEVYEKS